MRKQKSKTTWKTILNKINRATWRSPNLCRYFRVNSHGERGERDERLKIRGKREGAVRETMMMSRGDGIDKSIVVDIGDGSTADGETRGIARPCRFVVLNQFSRGEQ